MAPVGSLIYKAYHLPLFSNFSTMKIAMEGTGQSDEIAPKKQLLQLRRFKKRAIIYDCARHEIHLKSKEDIQKSKAWEDLCGRTNQVGKTQKRTAP